MASGLSYNINIVTIFKHIYSNNNYLTIVMTNKNFRRYVAV